MIISLGSEIKPLSNTDLEVEYMVGEYLNGCSYPSDYVSLLLKISKLPMVELLNDIEYLNIVLNLKKLLVQDSKELLKPEEIVKIYNGKSKAIELLNNLVQKSKELYPQLYLDEEQSSFEQHSKALQSFETENPMHLGTAIDAYSTPPIDVNHDIITSIKNVGILGQGVLDLINSIQNRYSEETIKIPKKISDFKMYINEQTQIVSGLSLDPQFMMKLLTVLQKIETSIPVDELNPFKNEIFLNIIQVLRKPEMYYSFVKNDKILSSEVSSVIAEVYPQTYDIATNIILDKLQKVTYQDKIILTNNCALTLDDSELVALCYSHIG